ncbi:hypothetical protein BaRGS_00020124 [Batillaria attramentaria]|uniref:Uncharacterized protein n=1 Tax=Batillaria attramentaria TaxID=370345 RepID=A0ABD0KNH3_9CAEN
MSCEGHSSKGLRQRRRCSVSKPSREGHNCTAVVAACGACMKPGSCGGDHIARRSIIKNGLWVWQCYGSRPRTTDNSPPRSSLWLSESREFMAGASPSLNLIY